VKVGGHILNTKLCDEVIYFMPGKEEGTLFVFPIFKRFYIVICYLK